MERTEDTAVSSGSGSSKKAVPALGRSRTSKVLDHGAASPTPQVRPRVGVPFLWEEAPGKPKVVVPQEVAGSVLVPSEKAVVSDGGVAGAGDGGGDRGDRAPARPVTPLKLPPRLQAAAATAECSLSPNTVLQGPYGGAAGGGRKPPRPLRRSGSTASCHRKPAAASAVVSLWKKATAAAARGKKHGHDHDAAALDATCRSPASSSSSSSSTSMSYFGGDDQALGAHRRQADGHEDTDDGEEDAKSTVRITRFRRNRSLPSTTASHLWASIRRSVKQITPWS